MTGGEQPYSLETGIARLDELTELENGDRSAARRRLLREAHQAAIQATIDRFAATGIELDATSPVPPPQSQE